MQDTNFRLFEGMHTGNLKSEQRTTLLATLLILVQIGLLVYLVLTKGFAYSFLGLYLLHLLGFSLLVLQVWFERHPEYLRHLTLTNQGVRYRTSFFKQEHDFDWEEIHKVFLGDKILEFTLKNDELHSLPLDIFRTPDALQNARQAICDMVAQKGISLSERKL
jgi:hypothetical protein